MSLVNQVLKDLERRHATQAQEVGIDDLHYAPVTPGPAKHNIKWLVFAGSLIVLGAITAGGVYWLDAWDNYNYRTTTAPTAAIESVTSTSEAVHETKPVAADTRIIAISRAEPVPTVKQVEARADVKPVVAQVQKDSRQDEGTLAKTFMPIPTEQRAALAYQEGHNHISARNYRKAESALRSALALEPTHLKAREMLSGVYISQGRWIEASELLREGVAIAPQHHNFVKLYARTLMQLKRDAQAISVLSLNKPAMAQDPEHYALLAALHQRQQQHDIAAQMYSDILKQHPGNGIWWVGMGISLEAMGDQTQAVAAYQQARKTGTLNGDVARYTDNRLLALDAIQYPIN